MTYTRTSHKAFLVVPDDALTGIRSSTEEYAALNARSVREALGTTWGIAETGASGPHGKPLRRCCWAYLHRSFRSNRTNDYLRDWRIRPRRQHVGIRRCRVWIVGGVFE